MGVSVHELDDKELYDNLEKAGLVDKLMSDPAWGMLQEAADRIVNRAIVEFALRTDPTDIKKVVALQVIIKKYRVGGLFEEIKTLKSESEAIYEEARQRGLLGRLWDKVENSF